MEETLMTPGQIAARLQVSNRTVYGLLRAGHLHGVRIGRRWRVRPRDLDRYLTGSGSETEWREELDALLERVRARIPPGITEEEVEADVLAAKREVRDELHAGSR